MNHEISIEVHFFLVSILSGGIILLAYDILRILRRLIKHGTFFLAVEDLFFWIITSVFIFSMIYSQNSGIIRGFSVMGMTIGMLIYHFLFKNYIVDIVAKGIRILLRPLALAINTVKKGIHYIITQMRKGLNFLLGRLKKVWKSVTMSMNKKRQALAAKRKIRADKRAASRKSKKRKRRSKDIQKPAEIIVKKEPVKKFERVDLIELRRNTEELHRAEPTNKSSELIKSRSKHKIEIKR